MHAKLTQASDYDALKTAFSVQQLIAAVYGDDRTPEIAPRLAALAALGPTTIADYVGLSEAYASDFEKLVYMLVSLRSVEDEHHWIHFELANLHHSFALMGLKGARAARFLHASLAMTGDKLNPIANAVLFGLLSDTLLPVAPMEALGQSAQGVRLGRLEQVAMSRQAIAALPAARRAAVAKQFEDVAPATLLKDAETTPLAGVTIKTITPPSEVDIPSPAKHGQHYIFKKPTKPSPGLDVMVIKNATLSVDIRRAGMTEFYVFDQDGTLIPQVSRGQAPFQQPEALRIQEPVALIDDFFSEMNICHFLLDKVVRLAQFDRYGVRYRPLLFRRNAYYDQVMAFLGVKGGAVCLEADHFTAKIDTLLVSTGNASAFRHPAQWFPDWAVDYLKAKFAPRDTLGRKRIVISRNDTKTRRVLNQGDVDAVLAEFGYESLELTGKTFDEQRALFSDASHVVGVHGAGLTNILFSPPGAQVLEILPPMCATSAYWRLSNAMGHRYHAAIALDPDFPEPDYGTWKHNPELNLRDIIVPPALLRERLTDMEQASR
jgi:capsular polysaccharide biosynthesis protein